MLYKVIFLAHVGKIYLPWNHLSIFMRKDWLPRAMCLIILLSIGFQFILRFPPDFRMLFQCLTLRICLSSLYFRSCQILLQYFFPADTWGYQFFYHSWPSFFSIQVLWGPLAVYNKCYHQNNLCQLEIFPNVFLLELCTFLQSSNIPFEIK